MFQSSSDCPRYAIIFLSLCQTIASASHEFSFLCKYFLANLYSSFMFQSLSFLLWEVGLDWKQWLIWSGLFCGHWHWWKLLLVVAGHFLDHSLSPRKWVAWSLGIYLILLLFGSFSLKIDLLSLTLMLGMILFLRRASEVYSLRLIDLITFLCSQQELHHGAVRLDESGIFPGCCQIHSPHQVVLLCPILIFLFLKVMLSQVHRWHAAEKLSHLQWGCGWWWGRKMERRDIRANKWPLAASWGTWVKSVDLFEIQFSHL